MLRRVSIFISGSGLVSFLLITAIVVHYKPPVGTFEWPVMFSVGSMAIGMAGLSYAISREWRAQVRGSLNH